MKTLKKPKTSRNNFGGGGNYYHFALCQLHHGHIDAGIETLEQAASMGEHLAAIAVAKYYGSNGYNLPDGKVTQEEANLQEAIKYEEMALNIIRSNRITLTVTLMGMIFQLKKNITCI